jgi:hypothetical protein
MLRQEFIILAFHLWVPHGEGGIRNFFRASLVFGVQDLIVVHDTGLVLVPSAVVVLAFHVGDSAGKDFGVIPNATAYAIGAVNSISQPSGVPWMLGVIDGSWKKIPRHQAAAKTFLKTADA